MKHHARLKPKKAI